MILPSLALFQDVASRILFKKLQPYACRLLGVVHIRVSDGLRLVADVRDLVVVAQAVLDAGDGLLGGLHGGHGLAEFAVRLRLDGRGIGGECVGLFGLDVSGVLLDVGLLGGVGYLGKKVCKNFRV